MLLTLGTLSYGLYLTHLPLRRAVMQFYGPDDFPTLLGSQLPGQLVFYAVAAAPAIGFAWLLWHLYERPFLRLKKWFPMLTMTAVPPALSSQPRAFDPVD